MTPTRRSFLGGLFAAPVIVRAGALMPVKAAPVVASPVAYPWREVSAQFVVSDPPPWVREYMQVLLENARKVTPAAPYPGATRVSA